MEKKIYLIFLVLSIVVLLTILITWTTGKPDLASFVENQNNTKEVETQEYVPNKESSQKEQPTNKPQWTIGQAQSTQEYFDTNKAELVKQEYTGTGIAKEYNITLNDDEVIAGQSWGFSYNGKEDKDGGCAFLICGAGTYTFIVTDGEWTQYKNVTTDEQADSLLQQKVDYVKQAFNYSDDSMKISRIP